MVGEASFEREQAAAETSIIHRPAAVSGPRRPASQAHLSTPGQVRLQPSRASSPAKLPALQSCLDGIICLRCHLWFLSKPFRHIFCSLATANLSEHPAVPLRPRCGALSPALTALWVIDNRLPRPKRTQQSILSKAILVSVPQRRSTPHRS